MPEMDESPRQVRVFTPYKTWRIQPGTTPSIINLRVANLPPMCLHQVSMPEADRPGSGLYPERHGAAFVRRASVCLPDDLNSVVMKVNRFGFVGTRITGSVHRIVKLVEPPLKSHEASLSAKLKRVYVDGKPHNSSGPSLTPGMVGSHDEFPKCQGLVPAAGFHDRKSKPRNRAGALWGVDLIRDFMKGSVYSSAMPLTIARAVCWQKEMA